MREKIVIIGANEFQNPLILKAKEHNIETHVFAWEDGAVGKENADFFYPISIVEKEKILEECRKIQPMGIISIASDLAMLTVNYIADQLGLVGNDLECTLITTDKYEMRKTFEKNGDPSPRYCLSSEIDKIQNMHFPLIVKPTDRSGSRGIMRVEKREELDEAIELAKAQSFNKQAIVEEFILGKEYSVEYISYKGQHHYLAITEKQTSGAPHYIETGHREPVLLGGGVLEEVKRVVSHALSSLKIQNGASHSEIMIDRNNRISIVEIGARMGGDCIGSDLVRLSTGYDFVNMVLDIACNKEPSFEKVCVPRAVSIHFIFNRQDLEQLEEIKKTTPQKLYFQSKLDPIESRNVTDSASRFGYYITYDD